MAVLQVRRPYADVRDGLDVNPAVLPTGAAAATLECYFAYGGAGTEQIRGALEHIRFVPYEIPSDGAVPVSVLQALVPELAFLDRPSVSTSLWRQFVLPGGDYLETCAALEGAGLTAHAWAEDAVDLAIEDRWRSDGG